MNEIELPAGVGARVVRLERLLSLLRRDHAGKRWILNDEDLEAEEDPKVRELLWKGKNR